MTDSLRDRALAGEALTLEDFTADSFLHADVDLRGCTGLMALPDGIAVGGDLWLNGCTGLKALPDGLAVGGYLNLYGCTGLKAFPDGLAVGRDLSLSGCTGLKGVRKPSGVKGRVFW